MAVIGKADKMLDFGKITLGGGTVTSENVVNLEKTEAERMRVSFNVAESAEGGTGVVYKVQGSNDGTNWEDIAQSANVTNLTAGESVSVGLPENYNKAMLRVQAVCTGTFTSGTVNAYIDTYMGA